MTNTSIRQKLTAVFYADVEAYSRHMRDDDPAVHRKIMALLDFASELIKGRDGIVLRYAGDAILAEFSSALAAVQAAVGIQNELNQRNSGLPAEEKVQIRIGLNLGEVMEDRGEIFGDGVNLAARLESDAQPGGICLSSSIRDLVVGKIDIELTDGGDRQYKNIDRLVRAYFWHPDPEVGPTATNKTETSNHGKNRKPTVYLGEGKLLDSKEHTQELYDSIGETLSSSLSNISGIKCVGQQSDADYLAEFSIQTSGNRYRLTLTLFDQIENEQYWSEQFTDSSEDIFDALDTITTSATTALRYEIYEREGWRLRQVPLSEKSTEDLMSESGPYLYRPYFEDYEKAEQLLDHAIALDSTEDFMLYCMRALAALREAACGYRAISPEDGEIADRYIRKAVSLNNRSEFVCHINAGIQLYWHRDIDAAIQSAKKAIELNPTLTICGIYLALGEILRGNAQKAFRYLEADINTYSRYSGSYWAMEYGALAHLVDRQYEKAVGWASRADSVYRDVPRCLLILIAANQQLGNVAAAYRYKEKLIAKFPDLIIDEIAPLPFAQPENWDHLVESWSAAGIQ